MPRPLAPGPDDMRLAARLVRAHAAGDLVAVRGMLAETGNLHRLVLALLCAVRAGRDPLLGPAEQLEAAAEQLRRMVGSGH